MRRREFITLIGGVAAMWPLAARAQQPGKLSIVGFLVGVQVPANLVSAFREGLGGRGFVEGQNVSFDLRSAGGDYNRFRTIADEFVHRQVAIIFATGGTAAALAAKSATATIPIVFYMDGDPVGQGLVASLNRPGGNLTGLGWLGFDLGAKRLELLHELLPENPALGILVNPNNPDSDFEVRDIQEAARILKQQAHIFTASSNADFDGVFETLVKQQIGALIVASDAFFSGRRGRIVAINAELSIGVGAVVSVTYKSTGVGEVAPFVDCGNSTSCSECRSHPQGGKAGRPTGVAADQVRVGNQSQRRQGARSRRPTAPACARRRGHRIATFFTAAQNVRFWHKADIPRLSSNVRFRGNSGHCRVA